MHIRRKPLALAALAIVSAAMLSGCSGARFRETRVIVLPDPPANASMDVRTANGAVDISTAPEESQTTIVAQLRATTRERLELAEIDAAYEGGMLLVRVEWPDGRRRSNEGASFDIEAPGVSDVTVDTGNGRIVVAGAKGAADLRTTNGRIVVRRHEGPVYAATSNGRVTLDGELTDVDVDTSNGGVQIVGAAGPVRVRTSNGGVGVELTDDNPGPVQVRSSNGGVRLTLGPAFAGRLLLDTSNGRVSLEDAPPARISSISRSRADLRFGEGGAESVADTSNGNVTVRFRDSDVE